MFGGGEELGGRRKNCKKKGGPQQLAIWGGASRVNELWAVLLGGAWGVRVGGILTWQTKKFRTRLGERENWV